MQAVSLVCHKYHAAIAPLMWYTLNTNLLPNETQSFEALINPQSMVLPHIRRILIATPRHGTDEVEHRLRLLLNSLPHDKLTHFVVAALRPHRHTIQMLLKSQRKLKELNFRISLDDASIGNGPLPISKSSSSIGPILKDLTGLGVYVHCHPNKARNSFEYYRKLLKYVPELQILSIVGMGDVHHLRDRLDMGLILQRKLEEPILTSLTTLGLKLIDLGTSHETIFTNMNLANLHTLSLIGCNEMAGFLDGLLVHRADSDGGYLSHLSDLEIVFPWHLSNPDTDVQAIQRFLETGPKLGKLTLDVSHHALIIKDAIIAQSTKLKSLELGTRDDRPARSYAVEEVEAILDACSELTHIAINLPAVSLGPLIDLAYDFHLGRPQNCLTHVETEFEAMLVSPRIARS